MASDASPSRDEGAKKRSSKKKRDHKEAKGRSQRLIEELTESGHVALQRGNNREALDCFKKAYKASIQLEDGKVQSACSLNLGAAYVESGSPQSGLGFLSLAAGQPAERGDRVADLQYNLAEAHRALGDQRRAAAHFLQAAQLYRSQGDGASEGDTCMAMGRCHLRLRDMTQAAQVCVRAAESYSVSGRRDRAAAALQEAAGHMLQSDDFTNDDIVNVLTQCLQLSDAVADAESRAELYNHVGGLFSQLRCFAEAQDVYQRAVALVASQPARLAVVLQNLGAACNSLGEYRPALDYHREAAGIHGSLGRRGDQARCFSNLGYAHSQLGEDEQAAESFLHALQGFRDADDYHGQLQACEGLAEAHVKLRRLDRATEFYKQALTAHAHCKDMSTSVQDHLVKKLTEAIQLQLSLSMPRALQRGPRSRRPISRSHIPPGPPDRNLRPGPRPGPSPQSQGREFNHQPHMPNGHIVTGSGVYVHKGEQGSREMPVLQAESTDRAAKDCGSEAAEQAACTVDQQDPRPVEQVDGAVDSTNGESSSLAQTVEPRPSGPAAINHLFRRLKSRVCAVM